MNMGIFAAAAGNGVGSEVTGIWNAAVNFLAEKGVDLGLNLLAALVILVVGRWIAKLLRRIAVRLMGKAKVDETLTKFLSNIVYTVLLVLVVLAAVNRLGVDTTSFAAVLAAAGFAVGVAQND